MTHTFYRLCAQEAVPTPYQNIGHSVSNQPGALAQEIADTAAWIVETRGPGLYDAATACRLGCLASVLDDLSAQAQALEAIAMPALYDDMDAGERRGHLARQLQDLAAYTATLGHSAGLCALRAHLLALADAAASLEDIAMPALCDDLGITVNLDE